MPDLRTLRNVPGVTSPEATSPTMEPKYLTLIQAAVIAFVLVLVVANHDPQADNAVATSYVAAE